MGKTRVFISSPTGQALTCICNRGFASAVTDMLKKGFVMSNASNGKTDCGALIVDV